MNTHMWCRAINKGQTMRNKPEISEQEFLEDVGNQCHNVIELSAVASRLYDEVVAEYYRNGIDAAYKMLGYELARQTT